MIPSTSYNKTNANIVAAFVGTAAVWALNKYFNADIPAELAQLGQGALQVILTMFIPNKEPPQ